MPEKRDETTQTNDAAAEAPNDVAAKLEGESAEELLGDLADLDLTIETVEERISPSETNVFDK